MTEITTIRPALQVRDIFFGNYFVCPGNACPGNAPEMPGNAVSRKCLVCPGNACPGNAAEMPCPGKGRELARIKWIPGILGDWDVSPDGKYVAFPHHDSHEARIRVVALEPRPHDSREREVELKGLTNIRGLVWSADPDAWFVSVDTTVGNRLLYVRLDGRFQSLGDIQGWAVPSPDGRRVAFLDRILAANAWMIDRR